MDIIGSFLMAGVPYFAVWCVITLVLLATSIILLFVALKLFWDYKDLKKETHNFHRPSGKQ